MAPVGSLRRPQTIHFKVPVWPTEAISARRDFSVLAVAS